MHTHSYRHTGPPRRPTCLRLLSPSTNTTFLSLSLSFTRARSHPHPRPLRPHSLCVVQVRSNKTAQYPRLPFPCDCLRQIQRRTPERQRNATQRSNRQPSSTAVGEASCSLLLLLRLSVCPNLIHPTTPRMTLGSLHLRRAAASAAPLLLLLP
ncbi:hypothetical protein LX36DRAFT_341988 [Colletotrichum falcatum]|nr:hypothetical protein LX36DRAFT_341988 [Colletotrichum falcatum]